MCDFDRCFATFPTEEDVKDSVMPLACAQMRQLICLMRAMVGLGVNHPFDRLSLKGSALYHLQNYADYGQALWLSVVRASSLGGRTGCYSRACKF